jgi:hypothetical protein
VKRVAGTCIELCVFICQLLFSSRYLICNAETVLCCAEYNH